MDVSNPDLHAFNVEAAIGYVLKEAGPEVAAQYQYSVQRLQPGERRIFAMQFWDRGGPTQRGTRQALLSSKSRSRISHCEAK